MSTYTQAETLHRLVKEQIDSGAVASIEEATELFRGYRIGFDIDESVAVSVPHQAALLTAVTLARRVFLGSVTVTGALDVPLNVPLPLGDTLREAVVRLGGRVASNLNPDHPIISIGGPPRARQENFHVRLTFAGWRGGIVPGHSNLEMHESTAMPLAAMLSAALAISEAFLAVRNEGGAAGHRLVGMSLWRPEADVDWTRDDSSEPPLRLLPSDLWLIGLGHLGQAYLWGLGLLPYPIDKPPRLVLQDVDIITPSTESTSILSDASSIGREKTRAMAEWAQSRGFSSLIYERLFDNSFTRQEREPAIALCGLDNALGRRALDQVGFKYVVEAGLGRGHQDFRTLRLHTLPSSRPASEIWKGSAVDEDYQDRAAYRRLLDSGTLDQCGVTLLANKAVGAPFVGAVTACLVLSEVLRLLEAGPTYQLIDIDLKSLEHRLVVPRSTRPEVINPGFVRGVP